MYCPLCLLPLIHHTFLCLMLIPWTGPRWPRQFSSKAGTQWWQLKSHESLRSKSSTPAPAVCQGAAVDTFTTSLSTGYYSSTEAAAITSADKQCSEHLERLILCYDPQRISAGWMDSDTKSDQINQKGIWASRFFGEIFFFLPFLFSSCKLSIFGTGQISGFPERKKQPTAWTKTVVKQRSYLMLTCCHGFRYSQDRNNWDQDVIKTRQY